MKVVLDANVILAGFGTRGLCEAVLTLCLDQHAIYISQAILDEVSEHLASKFKIPPARIQEIIRLIQDHAETVVAAVVSAESCRDRDDLVVLGTAVAAQAQCLITGDKDLLSLNSFQGIEILSPREFYERVR